MNLHVDEVGEKRQTQKGDVYYPFKSLGKTYNVIGLTPPVVGQLLECDVRESTYTGRNGRPSTSRWATVVRVVPPPKGAEPGTTWEQYHGPVRDWFDYTSLLQLAHGQAQLLEPNDAQARAAIVNTAMIGFMNGKIALPEQDNPPPPDDSDEPPYPDELK